MTGLTGKRRRYFTDLFLAVSTSPCLSEQWHGGDAFLSFCFQYERTVRLNTTAENHSWCYREARGVPQKEGEMVQG